MAGYQYIEVTQENLIIKFDQTLKASTLVNDNFALTDDGNTVPHPFANINLERDWIATSRTLFLRFAIQLQSGHTYKLTVTGLQTVFGSPIIGLPMEYEFVAPENVLDYPTVPIQVPTPIDVEDYSTSKPPLLSGDGGVTGGGGVYPATPGTDVPFEVINVTPDPISAYNLPPQYNGGKVSVTFSLMPAFNFINSGDFKLQKKSLVGVGHWENVNAVVLGDAASNTVNIYLPSQDDVPGYAFEDVETEGTVYWEPGYKYRLVISKNVGV